MRTEDPLFAHAAFEALDEPAARAELACLRVDAAVAVEVALELHNGTAPALTRQLTVFRFRTVHSHVDVHNTVREYILITSHPSHCRAIRHDTTVESSVFVATL